MKLMFIPALITVATTLNALATPGVGASLALAPLCDMVGGIVSTSKRWLNVP